MTRVLILFAHPALEKSRLNRRLIQNLPDLPHLTFHDLYEHYPTFDIDVAREQALLTAHDLIVLQHPFFWYSTPALVKQWEDLVLEHGWAYGSKGTALRDKRMLNVITSGGGAAAYGHDGYNRFTVREFLVPLEQTARLCGMRYLPPYLIQGTHRMTPADIEREVARYHRTIALLHDERVDFSDADKVDTLNELVGPLLEREARA